MCIDVQRRYWIYAFCVGRKINIAPTTSATWPTCPEMRRAADGNKMDVDLLAGIAHCGGRCSRSHAAVRSPKSRSGSEPDRANERTVRNWDRYSGFAFVHWRRWERWHPSAALLLQQGKSRVACHQGGPWARGRAAAREPPTRRRLMADTTPISALPAKIVCPVLVRAKPECYGVTRCMLVSCEDLTLQWG